MKNLKFIVLTGFLLIVTDLRLSAVTYFVNSSTGNDNNNGRASTTAWRTIARVNTGNYLAGDVISFRGGQTFNGSLYFHAGNAHGTAAQPVKITSHGTGIATIASGNQIGIAGDNVGAITITKLNVTGTSRINAPSDSNLYYVDGIYFQCNLPGNVKLDSIKIDTVNVSGYGGNGIIFWGLQGNCGFKNVTLTNVISHDNACDGFVFTSVAPLAWGSHSFENVNISYCVCYNLMGVPTWGPSTSTCGNGILLLGVNGGTISNNTIYNNHAEGNGGPYGIEAIYNSNLWIHSNECRSTYAGRLRDTSPCWDCGGINVSGMYNAVERNYTHNNDGPGILIDGGSGNVFRYNICENDGRKLSQAGIYFVIDRDYWLEDTQVYNNTVYMSGTSSEVGACCGIRTWGRFTPIDIILLSNNIFMTADDKAQFAVSDSRLVGNVISIANVYWNRGGGFKVIWGDLAWGGQIYRDIDQWKNETGNGWAGFNVDPSLRNPGTGKIVRTVANPRATFTNALRPLYSLFSYSACIDAAWDLESLWGSYIPPTDILGQPTRIPGNGETPVCDTGAVEWQFGQP